MDPHFPGSFFSSAGLGGGDPLCSLRRRARDSARVISVASALLLRLLAAVGVWFSGSRSAPIEVPWIDFGAAFRVPIGFIIDPLSKVMLLVVTGIGALIHIYSLVYMAEDEAKGRYFGGLSLFMFSMLGIVLANNFVMMFIFWELVGVSSLSADRPLVHARFRGRRREEGVHHEPPRRLRFHARHPDDLDRDRFARSFREIAHEAGAAGARIPMLLTVAALLHLLRCGRQVRAIPAACLVAGCDGRPDAGLRAHPCGDDGRRRRLHARARVLPHRRFTATRYT